MRTRTILMVALLALAPVACGSDDDDTSATTTTTIAPGGTGDGDVEMPDLTDETFKDLTGRSEVVIDARDNTFRDAYIEVDPGTTITFRNVGRTEHDVYPVVDGAFPAIPADALEPGDRGTVTFDESGEFAYYCTLHGTTTRGMVGAVRVLGE